jgi:hypothetical protein
LAGHWKFSNQSSDWLAQSQFSSQSAHWPAQLKFSNQSSHWLAQSAFSNQSSHWLAQCPAKSHWLANEICNSSVANLTVSTKAVSLRVMPTRRNRLVFICAAKDTRGDDPAVLRPRRSGYTEHVHAVGPTNKSRRLQSPMTPSRATTRAWL